MSRSVFFIIGQLGKGGAEKQLLGLCEALQATQVQVTVFVWSPSAKSDMFSRYSAALNNHLIIAEHKGLLPRFFNLLKNINRVKPDVLVSFTNYTNIIAFMAGLATFKKSFGSVRNSLYMKKPFFTKAKALIQTFNPRLISNNKESINYLKLHFPFIKTFYLPNAVALHTGAVSPSVATCHTLSIGALKKEKRIDRLIDFVKGMVAQQSTYTHIHLGGGELLAHYQGIVKDLRMERNLLFLGQVDNVNDYIVNATLLLHFSEFEGTPNVVMEGMANKKTIVTTNCGDVRELITDGVEGFVVDPYAQEVFMEKVTRCLADNGYREQLEAHALIKIGEFGIDRTVENFNAIIN